MRKVLAVLLLVGSSVLAQETPYFEYTWNEGDGAVAISATDLINFGQTKGRYEIDWTPTMLHTTDASQRLLDIPNHLGLWVWNDGIHGEWFARDGSRRLFRTRWGLPAPGVEVKIVVTWQASTGYAVIIDGVLRIHDWQAIPTATHPDPDMVSGVYGAMSDGSKPASGTFKIRTYDKDLAFDPCTVDVVGTINEDVPLDNTGDWSQGIDPNANCTTPEPPTDTDYGEVSLTWTPPTQNDDGTPLTDLAGYTIYYGAADGGPYPTAILVVDELATAYTVTGLVEGTYYFVMTAYNSENLESIWSNQATKIVEAVPTEFQTISTTAYGWITITDRLIIAPIGTVPLGTLCDESQNIIDKHVVPFADVTFAPGGAEQFVVLGDCQ